MPASSCLSALWSHGTTRLPLNGFLWCFFFKFIRKILKLKNPWKSVPWESSCTMGSNGQTDVTNYILITNLMHWLLFIHKILFSSTYFGPQVLIFRRIQLYTCSIWYCHSLWEFVVASRYTAWVITDLRGKVFCGCLKTPTNNCILLKMSTWGSKHVEEHNILWINNNQCIKLVIIYIQLCIQLVWVLWIDFLT